MGLLMRAKQRGFSMIEVLITIVVIGVAFVGLTYLHSQISEESGITFRQMESIDNGWQAMDDLRQLSADDLYSIYSAGGTPPYDYATDTWGEFAVAKRIISIHTNPNYAIIEGTSTWTDSNGVSHTDKFCTAIPEVNRTESVWRVGN